MKLIYIINSFLIEIIFLLIYIKKYLAYNFSEHLINSKNYTYKIKKYKLSI
jgi:hypothetical protein